MISWVVGKAGCGGKSQDRGDAASWSLNDAGGQQGKKGLAGEKAQHKGLGGVLLGACEEQKEGQRG